MIHDYCLWLMIFLCSANGGLMWSFHQFTVPSRRPIKSCYGNQELFTLRKWLTNGGMFISRRTRGWHFHGYYRYYYHYHYLQFESNQIHGVKKQKKAVTFLVPCVIHAGQQRFFQVTSSTCRCSWARYCTSSASVEAQSFSSLPSSSEPSARTWP